MPFDLAKFPNLQKLVDQHPGYRKLWLDGGFPSRKFGQSRKKGTSNRSNRSSRGIGGVGTELSYLLTRWGIREKPGCKCKARARTMDVKGIAWCEANVEVIVGWLGAEAKKRKLPFFPKVARLLVRKAIRNAKQQSPFPDDPIRELALSVSISEG